MSDQIIGASLELNGDQAKQSVKSFRQELKDAQEDLLHISKKFGEVSPQAVEAAKRVAEMRDRIGDARNLVDAFNPDAKFRAFANTIQGVAGGFAAVQGVMGLVGAQGEAVGKTLLKVQSALALSQGINSVLELKDTFKQLGAFIQSTTVFQYANAAATKAAAVAQKLFTGAVDTTSTSFRVLKGVIAATGIGLLVIVISSLIDKISSWVSGTDEAAAAQERLNTALEAQRDILDTNLKSIDFETKANIARAKIAGKSEEDITKIQTEGGKARLEELKANSERLDAVYDETVNNTKAKIEDVQKAAKSKQEAFKAYMDAQSQIELDALNQQASAAEKTREKTKQEADKATAIAKQNREKLIAATKQVLDELKALQDENFINSISDEQQREEAKIKQDADNTRKRYQAIVVTTKQGEEAKRQLVEEVSKKEAFSLGEVAKKYDKENQDRIKAANVLIEKLQKDHALLVIHDEDERQKAKIEQEYQNSVAEVAAMQISEQQKTDLLIQYAVQRQDALDAVKQEIAKRKLDKGLQQEEDTVNDPNATFESKQAALDAEQEMIQKAFDDKLISEEDYTDKIKALTQERITIAQAERDAKIAFAASIGNSLNQLSDLLGKQTKAGKAIAVASIIAEQVSSVAKIVMATKTANAKAIAQSPTTFGMPWVAINTAQGVIGAAASIAAGVKAVNALGGGGGSTASGINSAVTPAAPIAPTQTSTKLDADSINGIGNVAQGGVNRPVRAYMISGDIQSDAERNARIERAAKLGG